MKKYKLKTTLFLACLLGLSLITFPTYAKQIEDHTGSTSTSSSSSSSSGSSSSSSGGSASNSSICNNKDIPDDIKKASGCDGNSNDALPNTIIGILNAIITVSGLVAVVFVIVGGINFMTSTGDPAKVKKAKDTILYACIGLAVCALSFAIVNFVILNLLKNQTPSNTTNNSSNSSQQTTNNTTNNSNTNSNTPQKSDK